MRRVALVLAVVLPLALGGCGDSTGPGGSLAGTYALRSINGDPVPVIIDESGTFRLEMMSGFVRLNANGTFSTRHTVRLTEGNSSIDVPQDASGTYTRSGEAITLTFEEPESDLITIVDAVWEGDRLTLFADTEIWVYER
jgi:hypothetical protein